MTNTEFNIATINFKTFDEIVKLCGFAMSTDTIREYLCGVWVEYDEREKALNFIAADGHRLSVYSTQDFWDLSPEFATSDDFEQNGKQAFMIPAATVKELAKWKLNKNQSGDHVSLELRADGVYIRLHDQRRALGFSLKEVTKHNLVDYRRTIPADTSTENPSEPFNAIYLSDLAAAMKKLGITPHVQASYAGHVGSAIEFLTPTVKRVLHESASFRHIIMPVRL